jgi:hypothetical protein
MNGAPAPGASDVVIYVDRSDIRIGRLNELKAGIHRVVAVLAEREPRLAVYGFHIDEGAGHMTVTAVHPDSASLELHLKIGGPLFRELGPFLTLRNIEVYGSISETARQMLEGKLEMLGGQSLTVVERFDGFARLS